MTRLKSQLKVLPGPFVVMSVGIPGRGKTTAPTTEGFDKVIDLGGFGSL